MFENELYIIQTYFRLYIYIYINQIKLFKFFLILQHILYQIQIIHERFEAIYYISKLVVLWIINQYLISVFSRPDFIYKNTAFQHLCIYKSFFYYHTLSLLKKRKDLREVFRLSSFKSDFDSYICSALDTAFNVRCGV